METLGNFILQLIRQFAGGPGPVENNLVRFGLATLLWSVLLIIAWRRQKDQKLPREKMLVWGFGLAMLRELIMFGLITNKLTDFLGPVGNNIYYYPIEHGLSMISIVVVAGAFLQYALDDELLSKRFLQIGLALTFVALAVSFSTWPMLAERSPGLHFNETWDSLLIHVFSVLLLITAIILLIRRPDWLRATVSTALGFFLISEFFFLISNAVAQTTNEILCPIGNALHILAIPIFGYVYLKEMSLEKKVAEDKLVEYRDHLEELVDERTAMLVAQHEISDSLSRSLDLETIMNMAIDKVLSVLTMEVGMLFLLEREGDGLMLGSYRGKLSPKDLQLCIKEGCPYEKVSRQAIEQQSIIFTLTDQNLSGITHIQREQIQALISVPIISKDRIIGALALGSKDTASLDQTNLELLTAICHQIGLAVENAYLYQEVEVWADELSTLHQASLKLSSSLDQEKINLEIALQSVRLTGRQMACVLEWDESNADLKVLSNIGISTNQAALFCDEDSLSGLLHELSIIRTSIAVNNLQLDKRIPDSWKKELGIQSLLCTPIWGTDQSVEFLFIMDTRKTNSWHAKDVELVESFVSRAAVALENAHLYKQLEWAAALEERQRIAADMHDGLAQVISLLGLKIDNISESLPADADGKLTFALEEARQAVGQAMVEARKSISSLQALPQPQKSLQQILSTLAEQSLTERPEIDIIEFNNSIPEPLYLPPDQVSQIVPILQEAIINARKHSGATKILITAEQTDKRIKIQIQDNGKGFDREEITDQETHHFGLKIMRARASRFGGELQIDSKLGDGTTITLYANISDKEAWKGGLLKEAIQQDATAIESETYV